MRGWHARMFMFRVTCVHIGAGVVNMHSIAKRSRRMRPEQQPVHVRARPCDA